MVSEPEAADYPPPVQVWYTNPSGTTADFAGYGTLVDPRIVVLHQSPAAFSGGRDHESGLRRLTAEQPRVRCRLPGGRVVIAAGVLLTPAPQYPDAAPAVFLDLTHPTSAAHLDRTQPVFPWPSLRGTNRNDDVAAYLRDRAQGDPTEPPPTRPRRGRHEGETHPPGSPGIKPPWCWIWPACPGCR